MFRLIKTLVRPFLILILVGLLLLAYSRYVEPHMLQVENVKLASSHVCTKAEGFKIAAFSDTHFSPYYTPDHFRRVVEKINQLQPDTVFFLGDLFDHYSQYKGNPAEISSLLSEIKAPCGKFAVFGNHDYGGGAERFYQDVMKSGGFQVLINQTVKLNDFNLSITGIDDMLIGYGVPDTVNQVPPDFFNIVMCHEPDAADRITQSHADLMLASHTHGRQINLPMLDSKILPPLGTKYVRGLYPFDNQRGLRLYVTRGLGTTQLPLRFLSIPELTVITLDSESMK